MPCEILVTAQANEKSGWTKGLPVVVMPDGHEWGAKETLPNFIRLHLSDAKPAEVEHFLDDWKIKYTATIVAETDEGYRLKVEVNPDYISASDVGADQIKSEMQSWVTSIGGTVKTFASTSLTFDIAKEDGTENVLSGDRSITLAALKAEFDDVFEKVLDIRRYYFSSDDVDKAIESGGTIELTKAQALNLINDKLAE